MLNTHLENHYRKIANPAILMIVAAALAWELSKWIVAGNLTDLGAVAIVGAGIAFCIALLKDWRYGVYCFFIWIVFEDLIRKFTGNGTAMFFAKDLIIGLTYGLMMIAFRRRPMMFKASFFLWLGIFFFVGLLQVFNPNSPSVFYGLLGLKLYFYYVPLMFAGYALLRSEADLHKILMLNTWIALVVAGLGVAQSILGLSFLNPTDLAPELVTLGRETRTTPVTNLRVERITSVYVSDGRFAEALILFFILGCGTAGYLLMRTKRGRKVIFPTMGTVVLAAIMTGVRHCFIAIAVSTVVLVVAILWGTDHRLKQSFRIGKAIRLVLIFATLTVTIMILLFPDLIKARWALYTETLTPGASTSDLGYRAWEYPLENLASVFTQPNWQFGNGIGTASLGTQYVSKFIGVPPPTFGSESGYGGLILEFGMIGPILFVIWMASLLICAWRVVCKLKNTPLFPIGFAFFWYQIYILALGFFYGLAVYQNYLSNAYLWLTVGMLFRLPGLLAQQESQEKAPAASISTYATARA